MYSDIERQREYQKEWEMMNKDRRNAEKRRQYELRKRNIIKLDPTQKKLLNLIASSGKICKPDLIIKYLPSRLSKEGKITYRKRLKIDLEFLLRFNKIIKYRSDYKSISDESRLITTDVFLINISPEDLLYDCCVYNTNDLLSDEEKDFWERNTACKIYPALYNDQYYPMSSEEFRAWN